tara:strand:- start:3474 stop:4481 length:1008 start_codon:yes stop_codon:yes gene_type:complete
MRSKILIIAEAGINHNGQLNKAIELMQEAKKIGADIIKFQTFKAENTVIPNARKAKYQITKKNNHETQYSLLKKLELSYSDFKRLFFISKKLNIEFISTAFDLESLIFLKKLGQKKFKIPSGEINNLLYLKKVGSFKKEVILSTGMSTFKEIKEAIYILNKSGTPMKKITLLQCNTEYPTPFKDVNLNAMIEMKKKLNIKIGYSDHTMGIEVPIAAAALGAEIIEKHFTLNNNLKGPDHKVSLNPKDFSKMIYSIRNIEKSFGNKIKKPTKSEMSNKRIVRRSIVASTNIIKGDIFSLKNLTLKRPGTGISPMKWDKIIGRKAKRNFKKDSLISI